MERREFSGNDKHSIRRRSLRAACRKLAKAFDVPSPKLEMGKERGCLAIYYHEQTRIKLGRQDDRFGTNYFSLAHEFAHHVAWCRHGDRVQDHGPTWVRIYAQALHCLRVMPPESFLLVCRKYGIKYRRA